MLLYYWHSSLPVAQAELKENISNSCYFAMCFHLWFISILLLNSPDQSFFPCILITMASLSVQNGVNLQLDWEGVSVFLGMLGYPALTILREKQWDLGCVI